MLSKRLLLFPLFLLLASCALQPVTDPRRPNPENEPTPVPTPAEIEKPTYVVERGTVSSELALSGRITPVRQNRITFDVSGTISELLIGQTDLVEAGDVLARLDTTALEQSLASAAAELALVEAQLAAVEEANNAAFRRVEIGRDQIQLRLDYERQQAGEEPTAEQTLAIGLLELDLELAQLNLEELESNVDPQLGAAVTQAQRQVDEIEAAISRSEIVAPVAGAILSVNAREGDLVMAGDNFAVVADLNDLEVGVSMSGCDMRGLVEGLLATGVVANRAADPEPMTVRQLPFPYGSGNQSEEGDCTVRVAFDNVATADDLEPGNRVSLLVQLERSEDTLWLPPAAVREFNGRRFVVVQDGSAQRRVDVVIGLENRRQMEIESGVAEGEVIIGP